MQGRPKSNGDNTAGPGRGLVSTTPRWVKVFGIIGVALAVLFVVLHLTGHGFGHHLPMSAERHRAL